MSPSDRRPTGEFPDDSITAYRLGQLEAKQDIATTQNEKIIEMLSDIRTQLALGNTRMDASEKRLDAIEADRRAVTGLYTSIVALLGSIGSGIVALFSKHTPAILMALFLAGCHVRNAQPGDPDYRAPTPAEVHTAVVVDQFNYLYVLAVLMLALAAFLAWEGSLKIAGLIAAAAGALIAACLTVTYVVTHAGLFLLIGGGASAACLIYHYRARLETIEDRILAKVAAAFAQNKPPSNP